MAMRFRSGGLSRLGNMINVPLRPDEDGYIGRECPNPDCEGYFKIKPGTGVKGPAPCHCPYCGHTGDSNSFFTKEQIEYAKSVAFRHLSDTLHQGLKPLERDIRSTGSFGLGLSIKVTQGAPVPIRRYREKNLETDIVCDQCGLGYAIYGVFGWCPDCGVRNSLQILMKNLELARKTLALAAADEGDIAEVLIASALAGTVAGFDGFGRELCSNGENKASFQNLERGRMRVQQEFGFDIADVVTEEEWRAAYRSFQKRHLIAHCMGVIDEEYVQKVCDPAAVVGRKVELSPDEVTMLIGIIEQVGRRLYEGILDAKRRRGASGEQPPL